MKSKKAAIIIHLALSCTAVAGQGQVSLSPEVKKVMDQNRNAEAALAFCAASVPGSGMNAVLQVKECLEVVEDACDFSETRGMTGPATCSAFLPFLMN